MLHARAPGCTYTAVPDPPDLLQFDTTQKRAEGREFKANLRKFAQRGISRFRAHHQSIINASEALIAISLAENFGR